MTMATQTSLSAYSAFEKQLKTLCLNEFPCGIGPWKETYGQPRKQLNNVTSKYSVTLKDFGASHEKTENLEELVTAKHSPWNIDYSWSDEARELRELAVRSPWLVDNNYVMRHFRTLRIVDKGVSEVDEQFLQFSYLEELCLSVNKLRTINAAYLPKSLRVLELCANHISNLADLCSRPPALTHLGLGYNSLTLVDDYISGDYWPHLLSLDLSHNNLCDMMDIVKKLQTLPKLGNVVLQGNPLALMAAYRGYTIDSLRGLTFLDDISISADERHHYKGLAKRKENILDEAKVSFHVAYIKGVPMPEEMKVQNGEDQPEFPVITRRYFVQFMYPEDKSTDAEIFQILDDDQFSELGNKTPDHDNLATIIESVEGPSDDSTHLEFHLDDLDKLPSDTDPNRDMPSALGTASIPDVVQPELEPGKSLAPINSALSEWQEDIQMLWTQVVARDDLLALRNFYKDGMQVLVIEEMVRSFPADQMAGGVSPTPSKQTQSRMDKKKDDKSKEKDSKSAMSKDKKKKKDDVDMVHLPPEFTTLATFHMPLGSLLEGDFKVKRTFSLDWESGPRVKTPSESDDSSRRGKDKKKKPGSASSRAAAIGKDKKDKKEKVVDKSKSVKSDNTAEESGGGELPPAPPLELQVYLRLHHWKTAYDSMRPDPDEEISTEAESKQG